MTADPVPEVADWTRELASGDAERVALGFDRLVRELTGLRDALSPAAWEQVILAMRRSALFPILMEDPLTRRCFFQQGDPTDDGALSPDAQAEELQAASPTGLLLQAALLARPAWQALRFRRARATAFLRETLALAPAPQALDPAPQALDPAPQVLALATAPLHEVDATLAKRIAPGLVALDEDAAALDAAARRLPGLTCLHRPARALLEGLLDGQAFDASYALGLYNTLPDALAARLLARQVQLLRLGGRVMISNFARDAVDRGHVEVFLDWKYIYRDEADMERLVAQSRAPCAVKVYREPSGQMVFLELTKTMDSKNLE